VRSNSLRRRRETPQWAGLVLSAGCFQTMVRLPVQGSNRFYLIIIMQ
jgi:hypothetical protein